jgi:ribosome-associated protein
VQWTARELTPWIEWRFDPARGPGGQHVNKTSTRATLLFDFESCPLLTTEQRARIALRLGKRLAGDGRLQIVAQTARSQTANRTRAEERLVELLAAALHVEKPRRPTRATAGARRRRLRAKRQRGETKQGRRSPPRDAD